MNNSADEVHVHVCACFTSLECILFYDNYVYLICVLIQYFYYIIYIIICSLIRIKT